MRPRTLTWLLSWVLRSAAVALVFSSRALVRWIGIDDEWLLWVVSSAVICAALGAFVIIERVAGR